MWALKGNELTPELVFDVQLLSKAEAISEELVWKIWEYYQLLPLGNVRLFWTNRAQRNLVMTITVSVLLGLVWFPVERLGVGIPVWVGYITSVLVAGFFLFLDPLAEKLGGVWTHTT